MTYPPPAGGSGRVNTKPKPAPQKIAPQTTIRAARPPVKYSAPPPPPPVVSNNSGQYNAPAQAPRPNPGPIRPAGNNPPARQQNANANGPGGPANKGPDRAAIRRRQQKNEPAKPAGYQAEKGKGGGNPTSKKLKAAATRPHTPAPVAPGPIQPPGLDEFLAGDVDYQSGMSGLQRALQQYRLQNESAQGNVKSTYQTAINRMGEERTKALQSMKDDFASRGLLDSGMYAQANSDYDTSYNQQLADLGTDQQSSLQALLDELSGEESNNTSALEALRLEAIRRRAEQYGIQG